MGTNADFRPEARRARLVVRDLEGETLVYDLDNHHAHYLNGVASRLWRRSDGRTSVEDLRDLETLPEEEVVRGLQMLAEARLLLVPPRSHPTRRRVMAGLGQALALPAVVSLLVPAAAAAASRLPIGAFCGTDSSACLSGCCKRNGPPSARNTCQLESAPGQCF